MMKIIKTKIEKVKSIEDENNIKFKWKWKSKQSKLENKLKSKSKEILYKGMELGFTRNLCA